MFNVSDTSAEAHQIQVAIWRRLGPEGRVALALNLSEAVRAIARDGIAKRHPEYDEDELRHALFRLTLGDELYQAAWPDHTLLEA